MRSSRGPRPRAAIAILIALAAAVTAPSLSAFAGTDGSDGRAASLVTRIPGNTIFTGALQNLKAKGYDEQEFAITLDKPQIYSYSGSSTAVTAKPAPASPSGAYRSRFIVRMPRDPQAFNGRVLVEMMNTTAMVDLDIAWQQAHEYLMREGWAYVGITVQQTGLDALGSFRRDPQRYTKLGLNLQVPNARRDSSAGRRDPSLAWDLTTQVGRLVAGGGPGSPLAGYDVRTVFLTGQSQMAGYATTYINAIQPLAGVYDGFLVVSRSGQATNLQYQAPKDAVVPSTSKSLAQRRLAGSGAPVINLQSESDPLGRPLDADLSTWTSAVWRPDADTADDKFRLWEVAGSSHNDEWGSRQALGILERDYGLPFKPTCDWQPPGGINRFPFRYAWDAALEALAGWSENGTAPASVERIARTGLEVTRDSAGNAVGGLRLPPMDVPVARYGPTSPGSFFCPLTGDQMPFSRAKLSTLYPTTPGYVTDIRRAGRKDVRAGVLLPADAAALVAWARKGPVANAATVVQ